MSVLAQITVIECDGCKRLATLTNDVERETFDKTWLRTRNKDLCFLCREAEAEADQQAMDRAISKAVRKYAPAHCLPLTANSSTEVSHG